MGPGILEPSTHEKTRCCLHVGESVYETFQYYDGTPGLRRYPGPASMKQELVLVETHTVVHLGKREHHSRETYTPQQLSSFPCFAPARSASHEPSGGDSFLPKLNLPQKPEFTTIFQKNLSRKV